VDKSHFRILEQGCEIWNSWRANNLNQYVDLSGCQLSRRDLAMFNLKNVNLSRADLTKANILGANLEGAVLTEANLSQAILPKDTLIGVTLNGVDLSSVDLSGAVLKGAKLVQANLKQANLEGADLTDANLVEASAIDTNFSNAILTGACIENWRISRQTTLDDVICDYIYLKASKQNDVIRFIERRPSNLGTTFSSGSFARLILQTAETVDLIFEDGIDWQAFFYSFQELRSQYADQDLSIQAIEKKRGGAFVVRLEVSSEANKSEIESCAHELYETKRLLSEAQGKIKVYEEMMEVVTTLAKRPMTETINQTFNAQVGNAAGVNKGSMNAHIGKNADDVMKLITALQQIAQSFPNDQKELVEGYIEDLSNDFSQSIKPSSSAVKRRIIALWGVAIAVAGSIATATDFANNVLELSNKLEIPTEAIQPQLEEFSRLRPDFEWSS